MKTFLLSFFLITNVLVFSQDTIYHGERKFNASQLKSDFDVLVSSIENVHPASYAFIPRDSLSKIKEVMATGIFDGMNENEFHILVRQFIRKIGCGHTFAIPSAEWYQYQSKNANFLPFSVIVLNDQIFIQEYFGKDSMLKVGTEILSINNLSASRIIDDMKSIQERDGFSTTFEMRKIELLFTIYFKFLYGHNDLYTVKYNYMNTVDTIDLVGEKYSKSSPKTTYLDTSLVQNSLTTNNSTLYILNDARHIAILDINSFERQGYKKFYKKAFKQLEAYNIENLVIDLRGNGGGYFLNGNLMLRYLLKDEFSFTFNRTKTKIEKQPYLRNPFFGKVTMLLFNMIPDRNKLDAKRNYTFKYKPKRKHHYDGQMYVLIDGGTFSMSSFVTTKLVEETDAVTIGQETGGGKSGSNAILMYNLVLPATKIRVKIPYYHLDHEVKKPTYGRGTLPDYKINYTIDELILSKDKEMEKVMLIILQE